MTHALRQLRTFDDPVLSAACAPYRHGGGDDTDLAALAELMRLVCDEARGVGLAAPQVGALKRVVLIWPHRQRRYFMVNPTIVRRGDGTAVEGEGCLSYPGVRAPVARHVLIHCEWTDLSGRRRSGSMRDFEARVVQHEIDHLDGVCRVGDAWRAGR